jgi:hypothetical protein
VIDYPEDKNTRHIIKDWKVIQYPGMWETGGNMYLAY